jgi:putative acetyltransferase
LRRSTVVSEDEDLQEAWNIRWATRADYPGLADVMFDAVRNGPSRYSERQRERWVPRPRDGADWAERLDRQLIILAEAPGRVLGFMSLAAAGYVDFAYIRPSARGSGLFRQLYAEIEDRARASGEERLWVHASLMAEPAFAAMGFRVIEREEVSIGDETFARARMEKHLS